MTASDLEKIVQNIVSKSVELKNKYTDEVNAAVEFCDVFSKNAEEYDELTKIIDGMGTVIYEKDAVKIYGLIKPIETIAGELHYLKIRKHDSKMQFRGDADFNTDYPKLKQKHKDKPHFEFISREKFEMLRLSDLEFDVMACFSNIPVRIWTQT